MRLLPEPVWLRILPQFRRNASHWITGCDGEQDWTAYSCCDLTEGVPQPTAWRKPENANVTPHPGLPKSVSLSHSNLADTECAVPRGLGNFSPAITFHLERVHAEWDRAPALSGSPGTVCSIPLVLTQVSAAEGGSTSPINSRLGRLSTAPKLGSLAPPKTYRSVSALWQDFSVTPYMLKFVTYLFWTNSCEEKDTGKNIFLHCRTDFLTVTMEGAAKK